MKIDDSQDSLSHFKKLAELASHLAQQKIAIYEYSFTYMAFGSWQLVAGRRNKMIRFTYDGKDSYLSHCDSSIKPKNWQELNHRRIETRSGEDPFSFVMDILDSEFPGIQ